MQLLILLILKEKYRAVELQRTGVEENDERLMTEVNSRKGGRVCNKEKYPITDTSRFRLLLVVVTKMHSS